MPPILLHIYGPFAIHSFGVMIVLGLMITLYLLHRDKPLQKLVSDEQLTTVFQVCFFAAMIGGRAWFLTTNLSTMTSWTDCFRVWDGGLSILGAIISILITLPLFLYTHQIPILALIDRLALYAPLLQSISRLGCFFAGCCFGKPTNLPWAIVYKNVDSSAPLNIALHPTQIYSSLLLALIFIILIFFNNYCAKKHGQILALYIMLISFDRFIIDFLRADQEYFLSYKFLCNISIQQAVALGLFLISSAMMIFITLFTKKIVTKPTNESI